MLPGEKHLLETIPTKEYNIKKRKERKNWRFEDAIQCLNAALP